MVRSLRINDPNEAFEVPIRGFVSGRARRTPVDLNRIVGSWSTFRMEHPKAAIAAKWTARFIAALATTGASVLLSEELRKLYWKKETNETEESLDLKITVITDEFKQLLDDSLKKFEQKPNPGIFNLYYRPVTRVKRDEFSDFKFNFEMVPRIESKHMPFFPDQFDTYAAKNNLTNSGIVFFNYTKPTLSKVLPDMWTYFKKQYSENLPTTKRPFVTFKILEVSNVLILVGTLTITILALILMCCFCYSFKSCERRYINRDMVRARVLLRNQAANQSNAVTQTVAHDTPVQGVQSTNPAQNNDCHKMVEVVDLRAPK